MDAESLYLRLEKDFIRQGMSDDWSAQTDQVKDLLSENFRTRYMGLVCDFAERVSKVYTAVFPEQEIMDTILDSNGRDAMLFLHHPAVWNISSGPWLQMARDRLTRLRGRGISLYCLHAPLDHFSRYSTSFCLAQALGATDIIKLGDFGVTGTTGCRTVDELRSKLGDAVGHRTSLHAYGPERIKRLALVAGGANDPETMESIPKESVLVTGITVENDYSARAHEIARERRISLLGATHYSTEKFACIEMCNYFAKLGLPSEFVPGKPCLQDL